MAEATTNQGQKTSSLSLTIVSFLLTIAFTVFFVNSLLDSLGLFPSALTTFVDDLVLGISTADQAAGGGIGLVVTTLLSIWAKAKNPSSTTGVGIIIGLIVLVIAHLILVPYTDPYLSKGNLKLNDSLRDNSQGNNWRIHNTSPFTSTFVNGAFYLSMDKNNWSGYALAENTNFSNFVYEVQMTILQGDQDDCGGLVFRQSLALPSPHYYNFEICNNGSYSLYRYYATISEFGKFNQFTLVYRTNSAPSIHAGMNQTNLLAVVATSSDIELWANRQRLVRLPETTYQGGGFIGVEVYEHTVPTKVIFSNAKVWTLPKSFSPNG